MPEQSRPEQRCGLGPALLVDEAEHDLEHAAHAATADLGPSPELPPYLLEERREGNKECGILRDAVARNDRAVPVQPCEVDATGGHPFHPHPHTPRADAQRLGHLLDRLAVEDHPPERAVNPVDPRRPAGERVQGKESLKTAALPHLARDQRHLDALHRRHADQSTGSTEIRQNQPARPAPSTPACGQE